MLALTDAALARLCIGATRIDPRRRGRWLREIARKLDPPKFDCSTPKQSQTPAARRQARVRQRCAATRRRQARWRARHREGRAIFRLDLLHDPVVEALIVSRRLSEDAALRRSEVERELAVVVAEWAERWLANKG